MRTVLFFALAAAIISGCRSSEKPQEEQPSLVQEPSSLPAPEEAAPLSTPAEELSAVSVVETPSPSTSDDPELQALEERIRRLQEEVAALKVQRDQVRERNTRRFRRNRNDIEDASETLDVLEAIAKEETQ